MAERLSQMTGGEILVVSLGIVFGVTLLCFLSVGIMENRRPGPGGLTLGDLRPLIRDFLLQGLALLLLTLVLLWAVRAWAGDETIPEGMALIPAGEFTMGATQENITWAAETFFSESLDFYQDETPAHRVTLPAFFLDKTEVTVAAFEKYLAASGTAPPKFFDNKKFNAPGQPVVGVDWQGAADYCAWAGKRLPTESEWEKAARGTDGRFYPWGKQPDPKKGNVRGLEDGFRYTAPVGSFPESESPYEVVDLAGNVWEWTASWYGPHPGNTMESDLFGETFKVMKGGSWFSNLDLARASVRGKALPTQKQNYIGFRCARSAAGG